jgi:hypothetical protein
MFDLEFWESEVAAFKDRLGQPLPEDLIRRLLRGLAVTASVIIREHPDCGSAVQTGFHQCLKLVRDKGVKILPDVWLRSHASEEVADSAETFLEDGDVVQ